MSQNTYYTFRKSIHFQFPHLMKVSGGYKKKKKCNACLMILKKAVSNIPEELRDMEWLGRGWGMGKNAVQSEIEHVGWYTPQSSHLHNMQPVFYYFFFHGRAFTFLTSNYFLAHTVWAVGVILHYHPLSSHEKRVYTDLDTTRHLRIQIMTKSIDFYREIHCEDLN